MFAKNGRVYLLIALSFALLSTISSVIGQETPQLPLLHYVSWDPLEDRLISSDTTKYGSFSLHNQAIEALPKMEEIYDVVYSPDGQRLAIANGTTLTIIDAKTKSVISEASAHTTPIVMISWSPDGTRLVALSFNPSEITIWNVEPLESVLAYDIGSIWHLAWSPTADQIAMMGVTSLGVFILDIEKSIQAQHEETSYIGREASISPHAGGVAWNSTGTIVAVAMGDGTIGLFDVTSGKEIITVNSGHTDAMTALAFSPDGALLASASNDGTVRVHNVETRELVAEYEKGKHFVPRRIAFSPFGGRLAFGSDIPLETLRPGELFVESLNTMVVVPVVTIERLQRVAANCTNETSAAAFEALNIEKLNRESLPHFITTVREFPEGTIHESCRADLLAIAEGVMASP
jgi:WD40 repeat protein